MFWQINYKVDDGYSWYRRVCIIRANSEDEVREIFTQKICSKLADEGIFVISTFTEIKKCDDDVILYNGTR